MQVGTRAWGKLGFIFLFFLILLSGIVEFLLLNFLTPLFSLSGTSENSTAYIDFLKQLFGDTLTNNDIFFILIAFIIIATLIRLVQNIYFAFFVYKISIKLARSVIDIFCDGDYLKLQLLGKANAANVLLNRVNIFSNVILFNLLIIISTFTNMMMILMALFVLDKLVFLITTSVLVLVTFCFWLATAGWLSKMSFILANNLELAVQKTLSLLDNLKVVKVYQLEKKMKK